MKRIFAPGVSRFKSITMPLAVAAAALLFTAVARADDFTFSFSNTIGNVSGTVTGEVYGLNPNGTIGAASDVVITSFPSALNSIYGSGPIDVSQWETQDLNQFQEYDGTLLFADFGANTGPEYSTTAQFYLDGYGSTNFLNLDGTDSSYVFNTDGDSGITFTLVPAAPAVPEPSSLLLFATGMAGAAGAFRRKFTI